jgi:sugar O-acyltransferase (sialic acid O-acetyltransferase NeuD family)
MAKTVIIFSYSGHAFTICDIFVKNDIQIKGYLEKEAKKYNPYNLSWLGHESEPKVLEALKKQNYFISIGNNHIRAKVQQYLISKNITWSINAIHPSAVISTNVNIGSGVMIAANVSINALANIGNGAICNTGCIIEHECNIGNFAHIAPGAVLAGNVTIGDLSFVGANSVIKQGITVGKNVTIGAGTVVIKDIPDNVTVVGNPQRIIKK